MGLTLIEVLISVVILAVGAVLLAQALAKISYAQALAGDRAAVYFLAASTMAEVEVAVQEGSMPEKGQRGSMRLGQQAFVWEATSQALEEDPKAASVILTVSWRRGASTFERRLETVVRVEDEAI